MLNADTLLDRIQLKSQLTKWRLLAIVFAVVAAIASMDRLTPPSPLEGEYIARLTLNGIIDDDQKVYDLIEDTSKNNRIKAVVVWLNTPGGSAVGGEETFLRLRKLAETKPVVAVMRSVSASAGYMVALGADYIFAREGTITGSIGVIIETAEITELTEKLGIKPIIVKSAPLKAAPNPMEKSTPEAEQVIRDLVMDFYSRFIDMVAERRQLPRERVIALADGRVYSGRDALSNKLVDAIGGEHDAKQWLVEQKGIRHDLKIHDIKVKEEKTLLSQLTESLSGKFFQRSSVALDGLAAIWHPELH